MVRDWNKIFANHLSNRSLIYIYIYTYTHTHTYIYIYAYIYTKFQKPTVKRSKQPSYTVEKDIDRYFTTKESELKVTQSCLTLCDPMDYTVHGILQARILEWVAFPFSRGSSQPRDRTLVSHIAGRFFTS